MCALLDEWHYLKHQTTLVSVVCNCWCVGLSVSMTNTNLSVCWQVKPMSWTDVQGWSGHGGSLLGTKKWVSVVTRAPCRLDACHTYCIVTDFNLWLVWPDDRVVAQDQTEGYYSVWRMLGRRGVVWQDQFSLKIVKFNS